MAKDKKVREEDNLEQFGVWVKTGSDGIEEIHDQSIDIDTNGDDENLYITDEEEDLLNELDNSDDLLDSQAFNDLEADDFDLDSLDKDSDFDDLDFSDVASIEDTIEDSLPNFDDMDNEMSPLEAVIDKLEEQTTVIEESSRQLDILKKIESELFSIRNEIKDLKIEIGHIKTVTRDRDSSESAGSDGEEFPGQGFFDDSDTDETIALTGDELSNILDETVEEEETSQNIMLGDESILVIPEDQDTLPEDEYQDEASLLQDTPFEDSLPDDFDLSHGDEDPAISILTNADLTDEDSDFLDEEPEEDALEISIDDEGEAEEDISLDNLEEDEDLSIDEISLEDWDSEPEAIADREESIQISNDESEDVVSIDDIQLPPEKGIEEIDIEDMVESSPDDDLVIEEVDLGDLGIDLEDFEDMESTGETMEEEIFEEEDDLTPEELSDSEEDTLYDEGEEVSFDSIDEDIVFEDEGSFKESDEIESVDLSEFSDSSLDDDLDELDEISLDDITLEDVKTAESPETGLEEEVEDEVEPLTDQEEEETIEFDEISFDEDLELSSEDELEESLEFPESDEAEFELPSDDLAEIEESEEWEESDDLNESIELDDSDDLNESIELDDSDVLDESIELDDSDELEITEDSLDEESDSDLIITEDFGEEIIFEETSDDDLAEDSFNQDSDIDDTLIEGIPKEPVQEERTIEEESEEILETEEFLDLDLDLEDDDFNLENTWDEKKEDDQEYIEPVGESFSIEIEDDEPEEATPSKVESKPVEDLSIDEENIDEIFEGISLNDDLGDFGNMSEDTMEMDEEPVEESRELPIDTKAIRESNELKSLPYDLKEEIKEVLTYMDQLLEALPEDKIQEFARSEHFEVYKKIFTELGITK